ncbi:putative amino acid/amine transport protein [Klebsiella pneumoniae]|uniref:Putative amino acid/amine transport protein n=1 Tax=Klebsiella pneumoniae TaxID=573 RepID=A0A377XNS2_KLEPN|nr:putative amino acid/amine transport protein [Klebsiella pneumoniae]
MFSNRLASHLERGVVGFPTTLASSVGLIMASPVILTVTSGFGMGGDTFALAVLLAFIMMQAQVTTFAEAATLIPTTGSVYDYISCGMGRFFAITGALCAYLIVHIFAGTAETILAGIMALVNFESINAQMAAHQNTWMVGVGMVVIFGLLNAIGVEIFGKVEVVLTFGMWTTLTFSAVRIFYGAGDSSFPAGSATPLNVSRYQRPVRLYRHGDVYVRRLRTGDADGPGDQTGPPHHTAGDGAGPAGGRQLHVYLRRGDQPPGGEYRARRGQQRPSAGYTDGDPGLRRTGDGHAGQYWLGVGLLLAGCATINTLMAAVPRIIYGMALDGALPRFLTWLHPRFKTPVIAIAIGVAIPCLHAWYLNGDLDRIVPLILAAVCAWGVAYLLVTLSVVMLRIRRPDLPRAYRSPWFPLPQIISSVGIIIAIVNITPPGWTAARCWCRSA